MHIFQRFGIKDLTIEAMLAQLGISKGSLQGIAKTKEALLEQCVEAALLRRQTHMAGLIEVSANPVEALMQVLHAHLKALTGHHPAFLPDLKTAYPACWQQMQVFAQTFLQNTLTSQFLAAKEQQLLKPEINAALVSQLLVAQTFAILDTPMLHEKENNFGAVFKLAIEYYLRALLTEKGLALLDQITVNKASDQVLKA